MSYLPLRLTLVSSCLLSLSCVTHKIPVRTVSGNPAAPAYREADRAQDAHEERSFRHANEPLLARLKSGEGEENEIEADSGREAAEFFRFKRWRQDKRLPTEKYIEAERQIRRMPRFALHEGRVRPPEPEEQQDEQAQPAAVPTFGSWQSLGPGNIGGRVRGLAIHPKKPSIIYAGTATGGVWKTTNGGQTWFPLTDFLPVLSVSSLVMSPTDPNTLFVGTGEVSQGAGIFKTTNAGKTWVQLPATATPDFQYVYALAFSKANPKHMYAATDSGLWMSTDNGHTWQDSFGSNDQQFVSCFHMAVGSNNTSDVVYANCYTYNFAKQSSEYAVYRNTDAAGKGAWHNVLTHPSMGDVALAIAPSKPSTVYAIAVNFNSKSAFNDALLNVYRSTTNGDPGSWHIRTSKSDPDPVNPNILSYPNCTYTNNDHHGQGDYDLTIAVDPTNADRIFLGGIDLFRSDDGGAHWGYINGGQQGLSHVDQHVLAFHPGYNGTTNQTLFAGNDGGVFRTDNAAGQAATGPQAFCDSTLWNVGWTGLNHGFVATQFYHGTVYPGAAMQFGGTQDNGTPRGDQIDGPNGWSRLFGGDGGQVAIDPVDANTLFLEYVHLYIVKSGDGGFTVSLATDGINEPGSDFLFINYYAMDPFDSLRLYTGGNTLWRTLNGGMSWFAASAPIGYTNDGSLQSISTVTVSPADPNLVFFGTTDGRIYRNDQALSAGASTQWTYSRPGGGYISRIVVDPQQPKTVYAVNSSFRYSDLSGQIFRSTDGGFTWDVLNGSGDTAFPDIPAHVLLIDPNGSSRLYVGTDIGVFVSTDAGSSWMHDDNPYANAITESLMIAPNGGTNWLYAFTHGRGAWRVALPGGSGIPCSYSLSSTALQMPAIGGSAVVNVSTAPDCRWSALVGVPPGQYSELPYPPSPAAFVQSPATGMGPGQIYIVGNYNPGNAPRTATVYVQDQTATVNQPVDTSGSHSMQNDDVATARTVAPLPYLDNIYNGSYTQTTTDPVHSCTGSADFRTAWWTLVAPANGKILVTASDQFGGTGIVLTVYQLTGTVLGPEAGCGVITQADSGFGAASSVQFNAVANNTYAIEVSAPVAQAGNGGWVGLAASLLPDVAITPASITLAPGGQQQFTAAVTNSANPAVRWTLSPPIGTITPAGLYTAPASVSVPTTVNVIALSLVNPVAQASATVVLSPAVQ